MIKILLFLLSFSLYSQDKFINEYKPKTQRIDKNVSEINKILARLKILEQKVRKLESAKKVEKK